MYGCMSYFCRDFDDDDENVVSWIWLSDNGSKCRKAEVPTDHIYQTLAHCGPFSIPYNVVLWHYIPHIPQPWLYCSSVVHQRKEIQRQNLSSFILFPLYQRPKWLLAKITFTAGLDVALIMWGFKISGYSLLLYYVSGIHAYVYKILWF